MQFALFKYSRTVIAISIAGTGLYHLQQYSSVSADYVSDKVLFKESLRLSRRALKCCVVERHTKSHLVAS